MIPLPNAPLARKITKWPLTNMENLTKRRISFIDIIKVIHLDQAQHLNIIPKICQINLLRVKIQFSQIRKKRNGCVTLLNFHDGASYYDAYITLFALVNYNLCIRDLHILNGLIHHHSSSPWIIFYLFLGNYQFCSPF